MACKTLFFLDELYHQVNGIFSSTYSAGDFLENIDGITKSFCAPVKQDSHCDGTFSFHLKASSKIFCLPEWNSLASFAKSFLFSSTIRNSTLHIIRKSIADNDVIWVRQPSLPGLICSFLAIKEKKKLILHLAGDIRTAWSGKKYPGVARYLGSVIAYLMHTALVWLSSKQGVTTLCTGQELLNTFRKYSQSCHLFFDSMVRRNTFSFHEPIREKLRLIYIGRIQEEKGVFILLDSLKMLQAANIPFEARCFGFGTEIENFVARIENLGLKTSVTFCGYLPRINQNAVLEKSDILVCPSCTSEGFPRVILEAWASGLPVVASKVGGIDGVAREDEDIIFVEPGSKESLFQKLKFIFENPLFFKRLQNNILEKRNKFSMEFYLAEAKKHILSEKN